MNKDKIQDRHKILECVKVFKQYGSGSGATIALNEVDVSINEGELLVILGSSGSGKSTLLNMIGGMDRPTSGHIMVGGEDICSYNDRQLTEYRKNKVGFVFQSFNLIQELTAEENVALIADKSNDGDIVKKVLTIVGLYEKRKKYPSQLSGGEQQRVSIARALAKKSEFILCDEPTGALDYESGKQILVELESLVRQHGKTVVIVTHTQEIGSMADRVIKVRNGQITEETVNENPASAAGIAW